MKKSLFLAALMLISVGCFAQKNLAVKKAKSYINADAPDFAAARAAIQEALEAEPTAENYYWAGMIGYKQMKNDNFNLVSQAGSDALVVGAAVTESYGYFLKADSLAQILVLNKKGEEVPTDPKMRAKLAKMMLEYYHNDVTNVGDFVRYGSTLYEQKDFEGAYNAFKTHISIPELPMMQTEKLQKAMPRDSAYEEIVYFAAVSAVQGEMHEQAVEMLERLKTGDFQPILINKYLYQEYVALKDTANFVATLQYAIDRFPSEPWFLQNLINFYIFSGQEQTAIDYLAKAIEREPTVAQYHLIKGYMDENQGRIEDALADYDKAFELDPTNAEAIAGKGRLYYNQGAKLKEEADLLTDNKAYKTAIAASEEQFRKSLPLFEQAHEMNPTDRSYIVALKGLYYRFINEPGMQAKYDEMNEKLQNL